MTTVPEEAVKAMPERIYAKTHGSSTDVISGHRGLIGGWNEHKRDGQTEFVRSDLIAAYQATALEQAAQIAEIPVIGFSDGAVEASRRIASSIRALTAALPHLPGVPSAARELALVDALEVAKNELQAWIKCADENGLCVTSTPHVIDHINIALASLSSPDHADAGKVEGDGWMPIESAPKDGTEFLGHDASTKTTHVTFANSNGYFHDPDSHYYSEAPEFNPTHWRPLPSAPASGGAE